MKKKLPFLITIITIGSIVISCNKNNPTNNETTTSNEKSEISKEDKASMRLKVVDSIINDKKINSPYPNDFEVIAIKEIDSITYTEVSEKSLEDAKGQYKGTTFYVAPNILDKIKKLGMTKDVFAYVIRYKLRYRINDISVKVTDFLIFVNNYNLFIGEKEDYSYSHSFEVRQLATKLELALADEEYRKTGKY